MKDKKAILEPDATYHIFNRANGSEKLFLTEENYRFFLQRYERYISPLAETFSYCLMPNHFHFLVRVKSEEDLCKVFPKFFGGNLQGLSAESEIDLEGFLSQPFSNFFNSYTKAFNKQHGRKGNLFMHTFKRIRITHEKYLLKLIHYIHHNPVEAGLAQKPEEWKYSSYRAIISSRPTLLNRKEVVELFGDQENFIHCHEYPPPKLLELMIFKTKLNLQGLI